MGLLHCHLVWSFAVSGKLAFICTETKQVNQDQSKHKQIRLEVHRVQAVAAVVMLSFGVRATFLLSCAIWQNQRFEETVLASSWPTGMDVFFSLGYYLLG